MYPTLVRDARFHGFQLKADLAILAEARKEACEVCGEALHVSHYERKPRGGLPDLGPEHGVRFSLCCANRECRTRHTPPSLRFLGRRVYLGAVVVLVSAMQHGATPARMRRIRELVGVSRRTVERWREWWRAVFPESRCWREAAGRFVPAVETGRLPASLLERFLGDEQARLVALLRLLGPLTGGATPGHAG